LDLALVGWLVNTSAVTRGDRQMHVFSTIVEQEFNPHRHIEKILTRIGTGDVTIACWEPGQTSPFHCHPCATEIYFCFEGGGVMRTPDTAVEVRPGSFVIHPPGEVHEYANGSQRTLLFRVRYGENMGTRIISWRGNAQWQQTPEDSEYFQRHPLSS
jgi:mannose-6-phosphate isomerase-like protein (cupin superfamily)